MCNTNNCNIIMDMTTYHHIDCALTLSYVVSGAQTQLVSNLIGILLPLFP